MVESCLLIHFGCSELSAAGSPTEKRKPTPCWRMELPAGADRLYLCFCSAQAPPEGVLLMKPRSSRGQTSSRLLA